MATTLTVAQLAGVARPGHRVYLPGSSGVPQAYLDVLLADPDNTAGLDITTSLVPGINPLDISRLAADACVTGLFMQPGFQSAQREGQFRALATSYAGFERYLSQADAFDLCVVQLSPPDAQGRCSLGTLAEFTPSALRRSRRILGLINPQVPNIPGAASVALQQLDYLCHVDTPLAEYAVRPDPVSDSIANHVASLITDGSTVQMGLGGVPSALYPRLSNHRQLRLHSGMFSDGLIALHTSGALDPDHAPTTCALVGSNDFYRQCANLPVLRVMGCSHTHDPRTLLALEQFTAVNSALEVDLFGQCNLEHANGRAVSGCGGAPDFARAARLSTGGISIVALNATFGRDERSRIVAQLSAGAITSLPRCDVDCVVTEFGIADLRGRDVHQRARVLIDIAAPRHRNDLALAWESIAERL